MTLLRIGNRERDFLLSWMFSPWDGQGVRRFDSRRIETARYPGSYELEDWTCCGASSAHCTDEELAIDLAARNLAIAEKNNRELAGPVCGMLQPVQGG